MGVAGGVRNLQWLFTGTFLVMLAAVPLYGALVARLPRRQFIPLVYHFFVANLAIFWILLALGIERQNVARVFFIWLSVFNFFAVSVFWSFMADLYSSDQAKRLYGFIAAGGSAGALIGPAITIVLSERIGAANLIIVAAVLLELAVLCVTRLEVRDAMPRRQEKIGGGAIDGFLLVLRSPYIAGIMCWVATLSIVATFLYFEQASIVAAASDDPAVRTRIFATVDLTVGFLTLAVQFVATGKLIERFGVGPALALLPFVFAVGFAILGAWPMLAVVIAFQALQRTANFGISNPAREALFPVLHRDEKYKAKNVIDTIVPRGADALGGWLVAGLRALGMEALALTACVLSVAMIVLSIGLGRAQVRRAIVGTQKQG
ncbi:MAG: MFS transporter [Betaproteobacteria bacterium]|nr:MFS transporter [Betaproteobacteria bacterium]MBV9362246.1 MFS transporter [Betaproteobacteria bacterium]